MANENKVSISADSQQILIMTHDRQSSIKLFTSTSVDYKIIF